MTVQPEQKASYLVVRNGNQWRDVFRLMPGQVTTIGRSANNRVVVRDEVCSRNPLDLIDLSLILPPGKTRLLGGGL